MSEAEELKLPSLQGLQSAEQMELLNVIDSLRASALSELIALPQLIVCGDQSSGKSSVLSAISGIPFPRQDGLCTRFATEVILRRAARDTISVSIVPSPSGTHRTLAEREKLESFRHELKSRGDFKDLFALAADAMGLSKEGNSFSRDVLRVEFCGPSQPPLTLVDLPGLIHTATKMQKASDVELVHGLVVEYLKNPRSIILAVVSAKNDIGNQIILHKAREFDPKGLRTLGIITKPDLLTRGSRSEASFIALARNEEVKFSLGWHVVRNMDVISADESPASVRDEQELSFFQTSSFSRLPTHTTGIAFLRERLSKVLFKQIQTELPRLVVDIEKQILVAKSTREKLGPSRKEYNEQLSFLISLSQTFQTICRDAVRGDYENEFFHVDDSAERRLCANVMNMHSEFAQNIRLDGATWLIDDKDSKNVKYKTRKAAIEEACILLKRSRGRELPGIPNPLLVGELFRQYSLPWGEMARSHIKRIWETTMGFLELLLRELTDDEASDKILRFWLYPAMEEKLALAYSKLDELLEVHKDYPMTTNIHFMNRKQKPTAMVDDEMPVEPLLKLLLNHGESISIGDVQRALSSRDPTHTLDLDMVAAEEAFGNMNAYYEVAMNLFTDNVPTLAIQGPIIRAVPQIFCPTAVDSMGIDTINRIAGETAEKVQERDEVLRRLQALEKGARICKLYAKRPQSLNNPISSQPNIVELPSMPSKAPNTKTREARSVSVLAHQSSPSPSSTNTSRSQSPSPGYRISSNKAKSSTPSKTTPPSTTPFGGSSSTTSTFGSLKNGSLFSSAAPASFVSSSSPSPATGIFGTPMSDLNAKFGPNSAPIVFGTVSQPVSMFKNLSSTGAKSGSPGTSSASQDSVNPNKTIRHK